MMDWDRFNDQFAEDDDERAERQRAARNKRRCPQCGQNPNLGYPHLAICPTQAAGLPSAGGRDG